MQLDSNNLNEYDEEPIVRPGLLTVLCILTFIGSSWQILSSAWGFARASKTADMFSSTVVTRGNDSTVRYDSVTNENKRNRKSEFRQSMLVSVGKIMTVENLRKSSIGAIVSAIFTLLGALLMWWLKRNGFYLYIIGILIGLAVPFYLYGNNLLAIGISSFSSFFGLIFIALYALNIKSMK